jgi:hypothetical protein
MSLKRQTDDVPDHSRGSPSKKNSGDCASRLVWGTSPIHKYCTHHHLIFWFFPLSSDLTLRKLTRWTNQSDKFEHVVWPDNQPCSAPPGTTGSCQTCRTKWSDYIHSRTSYFCQCLTLLSISPVAIPPPQARFGICIGMEMLEIQGVWMTGSPGPPTDHPLLICTHTSWWRNQENHKPGGVQYQVLCFYQPTPRQKKKKGKEAPRTIKNISTYINIGSWLNDS